MAAGRMKVLYTVVRPSLLKGMSTSTRCGTGGSWPERQGSEGTPGSLAHRQADRESAADSFLALYINRSTMLFYDLAGAGEAYTRP